MLFLFSGWWAVTSLRSYYYDQRSEEAELTVDSYVRTLTLAIDAQSHLEHELSAALEAALAVVAHYPHPITDAVLASLAEALTLDVIYRYNADLTVTNSNDGSYLGWTVPPDHPVRDFLASGERMLIEDVREDTESGQPYKYGMLALDDGSMIQVGIKAEAVWALYDHFTPQYIIDELGQYNRRTRLALLDKEQIVVAATDASKSGERVDMLDRLTPPANKRYRIITFEGTSYLAFTLPTPVDLHEMGTLAVLFDLTALNWLIHWISIALSLVLLLCFLFFLRSFSKIYRLNRKILDIATHDALTGLPNLTHFNRPVDEREPSALLVINPANFKRLNMLYGYAHGDTVLTNVAHFLQTLCEQEPRHRAYRLSDDRFLLSVTGQTNHEALADLSATITGQGRSLGLLSHPGLTIGISWAESRPKSRQTLLKEALIALDGSSSTNPVQFYNTALEAKLVRDSAIEGLLRRAIDGERGLISLSFQPIYECSTRKIVAFEALARLNSAELGPIGPDEFIPIAEKQQLIITLGTLLFPMALSLLQRLGEHGLDDIRVAINISALQLLDDNFIHAVKRELERTQVKTALIEFELTESAFIEDEEILSSRLKILRALGCRLALDDFGSGYSSLSRLRSLHFDTLKLGRPFITEVVDHSHALFINDIISMAHHLGMRVVAEGVENEDQRNRLALIKCDLIQGYLIGTPLTLDEAVERCLGGGGCE